MKKFIQSLLLAVLLLCSSAVWAASEPICAARATLIYNIGDYRSEGMSESLATAKVRNRMIDLGFASPQIIDREIGNVQYMLDWLWKYPKIRADVQGEEYYKACVKFKNGI